MNPPNLWLQGKQILSADKPSNRLVFLFLFFTRTWIKWKRKFLTSKKHRKPAVSTALLSQVRLSGEA